MILPLSRRGQDRPDHRFPADRTADEHAAKRSLTKAIRRHGVPETITIDGSAANEAAIKSYKEEHGTTTAIRKVKYLNNIIEQDHRGVKRVTRPKPRQHLCYVYASLSRLDFRGFPEKFIVVFEGFIGFPAAKKPTGA